MISLKAPKLKGAGLPTTLLSTSAIIQYSLIALGMLLGRKLDDFINENIKPMTGVETLVEFPGLLGGTYVLTMGDLLYMIFTVPLTWILRKLGGGIMRYIGYGLLLYIVWTELYELVFGTWPFNPQTPIPSVITSSGSNPDI